MPSVMKERQLRNGMKIAKRLLKLPQSLVQSAERLQKEMVCFNDYLLHLIIIGTKSIIIIHKKLSEVHILFCLNPFTIFTQISSNGLW